MLFSASLSHSLVDLTTLSLLAVCISALLGMFLLFTWMQQREVKALAWWGSAYLLGAGSMLLQSMPPERLAFAPDLPGVMIFVACGMIWNGVRMFQGRTVRPLAGLIGAIAWLTLCQVPVIGNSATSRIGLGVLVVAGYTFFIAFELWRERRKSMLSHAAAIIIPAIHAAIFLMPLALRWLNPARFANSWLTILAMETTIYGIGTAFIVLMAVKDRHVLQYRHAANTDHLTGISNRRAFLDAAIKMQAEQGARGGPVTLLMFDLDHFKSVNDRFGHACGDSVLRLFAKVAQSGIRATDVVGRLGGEEFAAIVPEAMADAVRVAERLRLTFAAAAETVDGHGLGGTVSIGLASSYAARPDIDALILRADEALYRAKEGGRNRYCCADEEPRMVPALVRPARRWLMRRRKAVAPAVAG